MIFLLEHSSIQTVRGVISEEDSDAIVQKVIDERNNSTTAAVQIDQDVDDPNYDPLAN